MKTVYPRAIELWYIIELFHHSEIISIAFARWQFSLVPKREEDPEAFLVREGGCACYIHLPFRKNPQVHVFLEIRDLFIS